MKKSTSAFTIIELSAVIVIIAILAVVTVASYNGIQARARDASRRADVANLVKALEQYYSDNNSYPDPISLSGSVIGNGWYSSGDASWNLFTTDLAGIIDTMPKDPKGMVNGNPISANSFAYAYYTGAYCGKASGQWYLLVYRFEASTKEKFSDGACTDAFGDTYFTTNGSSYYRSTK